MTPLPMPPSRIGLNVMWEALEKANKIVEEGRGALVNAFLPSLESGRFETEREGAEADEEDVKEDDER